MRSICQLLQERSNCNASFDTSGLPRFIMEAFLKLFILLNYLYLMYFIFTILYALIKWFVCNRGTKPVQCPQQPSVQPTQHKRCSSKAISCNRSRLPPVISSHLISRNPSRLSAVSALICSSKSAYQSSTSEKPASPSQYRQGSCCGAGTSRLTAPSSVLSRETPSASCCDVEHAHTRDSPRGCPRTPLGGQGARLVENARRKFCEMFAPRTPDRSCSGKRRHGRSLRRRNSSSIENIRVEFNVKPKGAPPGGVNGKRSCSQCGKFYGGKC
ncbi:hypothetical protein M8J75_001872 [Diaphorina citri]|nr:hypothetical protein M8J75_001872 [Diaphorina citri]